MFVVIFEKFLKLPEFDLFTGVWSDIHFESAILYQQILSFQELSDPK